MSIRRSSLICVAYLQVYERVADNRWWPNIGGLLYELTVELKSVRKFFATTFFTQKFGCSKFNCKCTVK